MGCGASTNNSILPRDHQKPPPVITQTRTEPPCGPTDLNECVDGDSHPAGNPTAPNYPHLGDDNTPQGTLPLEAVQSSPKEEAKQELVVTVSTTNKGKCL